MLKRWFKHAVMLTLAAALVLFAAVYVMLQYTKQTISLEQPKLFTVESGQSAHGVINHLYNEQIIQHPVAFKILIKLRPELARIKAGTYELLPAMNGEVLLALLSSGQEKQFSIRLVEGLRWRDWWEYIQQAEYLQAGDEQAILDTLKLEDGLEGWLLPDTYHYTYNASALSLVKRAHQSMQSYLENAWHHRALDLPYETPYEALIMASIIEKETAVPAERPRIAGVFVNRLNMNMRLQTDPTVIYGMGESFNGNITRADLKQATPYNTYVIKGMPPTPIAMPGKLAIDAALNPMQTDEIYFVSKGDGSHKFSVTLSEHNQAVRKYQLKK